MGYRGKLAEQARARELRAQGWTLNEIVAELGVAKSSASVWVKDVPFVARPRRPGAPRPRQPGPNVLAARKAEEIAQLRTCGQERLGTLSERDLLIAGIALYAGEGAKRDGRVSLANSDPRFIALFCRWLRRFFDPDERRLRGRIYLHEGLDLQAATEFWAELTRIPEEQFTKPYRAVPDGGIRHNKHPHGCLTVSYGCARTHRAVMGLVHALLKPDMSDAPPA